VPNFSPIEKAEAAAFAQTVYDSCFMDGGFSKEELADYLAEIGIWTPEDEESYNKIFDDIQLMKVDYFDNFAVPSRRDRIKSAISKKVELANAEFHDRAYLYDYTCEAAKDEAYGSYLFKDYDSPILFYRKFLAARIQEEELRELYFDPTWRMIWSISKDTQSIFGLNANALNDNQLGLLYWSKVYDSISESSEAPNGSVMRDTIAVDGWMIKQSKNREAEERKKVLPGKEASETFVVVSSAKEAKEINNLNGIEGKQILKSRARDLTTNAELDERQFSHVKQEIGIRKNELSFRGK
jgi:hypothetical protein